MMVSDMLGETTTAAFGDGAMAPSMAATAVVPSSLAPEVEAMVTRYEGDYEAVKARSLASTPGLRGKLSDLASQLARVQDENDAIRQRYLELEDAWTSMGDENAALVKRVAALESKLGEVHSSFLESRDLAEATKQSLIAEQLEL